jgi:hypothetical protein
LRQQAEDFAARLTETVRAVAGSETAPFMLRGSTGADGSARITVRQEPSVGLLLNVHGQPLLRLRVDYRCVWDHAERYLAIERSRVSVLAAEVDEPLFRYDYVRASPHDMPSAHIQVHAHRDALTYVMAMCGQGSARARRRTADLARGTPPHLSDLHLPVGGPRFRPCLEDVLEMLINELGVDAPSGARQALQVARVDWRRHQLAAAVRDSPETAARVLADELGYRVSPPPQGPAADRVDRLQAL